VKRKSTGKASNFGSQANFGFFQKGLQFKKKTRPPEK
jgi:hypothetical protein